MNHHPDTQNLFSANAVNHDALSLLRECSGCLKSAVGSMDAIAAMLKECELSAMVSRYRALYGDCSEKCQLLLSRRGEDAAHTMPSKAPSWLTAEVKLAFRSDDVVLAAVLFDGTNTLIRTLYQELRLAPFADEECRRLARRLIGVSEDFRDDLKPFL